MTVQELFVESPVQQGYDPWSIKESDFPINGSKAEQSVFMLRYAILAPSVHNTQPWAFEVTERGIRIFEDLGGWLAVADRDKRDLHLSVGCALENLLIAAFHYGFSAEIEYFPNSISPTLVAEVELLPALDEESPWQRRSFDAITVRHTDHGQFDAETLAQYLLNRMRECVTEEGLECTFITDVDLMPRLSDLLIEADARQFADPAVISELKHWMNRGVFSSDWLLKKLSRLSVRHLQIKGEAGPNHVTILKDAPAFGIVASDADSPEVRVRAGQAFERLFLQATASGLGLEPMTHVLQVAETRAGIAELLHNKDMIPQVVFRVGFKAPDHLSSSRRPLEQFLIQGPQEPATLGCATDRGREPIKS